MAVPTVDPAALAPDAAVASAAPVPARPTAAPTPLETAQDLFRPDGSFLDTASAGLPPSTTVAALQEALATWSAGRAAPADYDACVTEARQIFARLAGVPAENVAAGSQTSVFAGMVAASLPAGAEVVAADGDFTSLLFPFLARPDLVVRLVPLEELAGQIGPRTHLVAVSAAQSATGALADLDAVAAAATAYGARTLIDTTQSCGWLPTAAARFDYTVCSAYKWLLAPRGTAFLTASSRRWEELLPVCANWYAGPDPWSSIYGGPLRLAPDARRFDLSPAWLCWVGAVPSLRVIEQVGVAAIGAHDVALANRFRAGLGLPAAGSAIVSVAAGTDAPQRLAAAGVAASARAGRLRAAFHLYNTEADVDRALAALSAQGTHPLAV
jgi:selenocysteine lyase/cysteine desulfurase